MKHNHVKIYSVKAISEKGIIISGKGNHSVWGTANNLTDFSAPWNSEPIKKTEFKALHNSEYIFFLFKVDDSHTHIHPSKNNNESINNSDRVELFFRSDASLNPYYCIEIDPNSRLMDFKATPNKQFDFNWSWPSKYIEIKSSIQPTYFTVEIAISIAALTKFHLLKNGQIETGIFRVKYNPDLQGDYEPTWITWVNPNTKTPNFHTSTSFGIINLEDY